MKKCTKILSLVLALVMLLSVLSVGFSSFAGVTKKELYTNDALKTHMLADDKYELTPAQYATMMLDFADKALENAAITPMTIPIANTELTFNFTSLANVNKTIMDLNSLLSNSTVKALLKDVGKMDLSGFSSSTNREVKDNGVFTTTTDTNFLTAVVNLVNKSQNNTVIGNIIRGGIGSGDNQVDLGLLNSTVSGMSGVKDILDDPVGYIKKQLNVESFDASVGTIVSDLINGLNLEMLDGYTFSQDDSIYLTIDKLVRVLTKWVVKNIQNDTWQLKDLVLNAIPDFETQYPFVKLDNITNFNWDWQADGMGTKFVPGQTNTYIIYHLNNLVGRLVNTLIPEFADFQGTFDTKGWQNDASVNSLDTLNNNIAKAAQYADIKLNDGGTFTAAELESLKNSGHMTKSYAMVLADALLKMFFPSIKVSKENILAGNICILAVQALNEFFSYYLPEKTLTAENNKTPLYTYTDEGPVVNSYYTESVCKTLYKSMGAEVIAKFATGFLPSDKINFSNKSDLDTVLKDLGTYLLSVVCKAGTKNDGALGTVKSGETVYTAIDRIIFSLNTSGGYIEGCTGGARNTSGILPEGLLPDSIKSSSHTHCTTKDVIDHLFKCIESLDVGALLKILIPNGTNSEMNTKILPNLGCLEIIRIINVFFSGSFNEKTTSIDALLTRDNLGKLLQNILAKLSMDYHVYPALKLVANMMGLASPQTRGEAEVDLATLTYAGSMSTYTVIDPVIESTSTAIADNKYFIKVSNTSKGINGGYHDSNYVEFQWTPYILKVTDITCENDTSVKVRKISGEAIDPEVGVNISSDSEENFKIIGPAQTGNKVLTFLVKYYMLAENGRTPGMLQEARLNVYIGTNTYTTVTSNNAVTAKIPTTIYASPSMLNNALGIAIAGKANTTYTASSEGTVFPKALEDAGFGFSVSDIGIPKSTSGTQYKPFTASAPSGADLDALAKTYTITYSLKSKDSSNTDADFSDTKTANINWVLFNDAGLPSAISSYQNMALQAGDFPNAALWNAFQTELAKAVKMVDNPTSTGATAPAALKSAYEAEVEALKTAYEALRDSSTADYSESLKQRLAEYSEGDAENNVRAKYARWDYTPVSYSRYSDSLSTIRSYITSQETSSVKVTEALRYNKQMAEYLYDSAEIRNTSTPAAKQNLQSVYNAYSNTTQYNTKNYTQKSMTAILKALEDAQNCINGTGLDGNSAPKISDYADARVALLTSVNQLVKQPLDVEDLITLIDQTNTTYNDKLYYAQEAWDRLQNAIKVAEDDVINDPFSLLPEEYTDDDIAAANALVKSKYEQDIRDAITHLLESPYVSSLLPGEQEGVKTFSYGEKLVIGSKVVEINDDNNYVVVYYGAKVTELTNHDPANPGTYQTLFSFSKNTTSDPNNGYYNQFDQWVPATYGNDNSQMKFKVYKDSTLGTELKSGYLATGNVIKVYDKDDETKANYYTVATTGNVNNLTISARYLYGSNKSRSIAGMKTHMLNIINNVGVSSIPTATALACDLNQDGMVDVTDLVLLKMWENGKANDQTAIKFPFNI